MRSAGSSLIDVLCEPPKAERSYDKYLQLVDSLISTCEHIDVIDPVRGMSALHAAATHLRHPRLSTPIFEKLVDQGWSVGNQDSRGDNALHIAIRRANTPAVTALLRLGSKPNTLAEAGTAHPLDLACDALRRSADVADTAAPLDILARLVRAGARVPRKPLSGSRLHCLIAMSGGDDQGLQHDFVEAVALLLDAGAKTDVVDGVSGRRPIHCAAAKARWQTLAQLLRRGADIRSTDVQGRVAADHAEHFAPHSHQTRAVIRAAELRKVIFG